jgi:hypothetical protein
MAAAMAHGQAPGSAAKPALTAIDILLEPDATMLRRAEAVNASHRELYPQGFALDAAHRPHITLIQRFVRTADLDEVYAAASAVIARANVTTMKLEAFKYWLFTDSCGSFFTFFGLKRGKHGGENLESEILLVA